jgi:hypothetical protein
MRTWDGVAPPHQLQVVCVGGAFQHSFCSSPFVNRRWSCTMSLRCSLHMCLLVELKLLLGYCCRYVSHYSSTTSTAHSLRGRGVVGKLPGGSGNLVFGNGRFSSLSSSVTSIAVSFIVFLQMSAPSAFIDCRDISGCGTAASTARGLRGWGFTGKLPGGSGEPGPRTWSHGGGDAGRRARGAGRSGGGVRHGGTRQRR